MENCAECKSKNTAEFWYYDRWNEIKYYRCKKCNECFGIMKYP